MNKRKLRFFCDYCADSPLWESFDEDIKDWPDGEYNKSKETLFDLGVSIYTMCMIESLDLIYSWRPAEERLNTEEENAFNALQALILKCLQEEIGDRFDIEVL